MQQEYCERRHIKALAIVLLVILVVLLAVTNVSCDQRSKYVGIYYGVNDFDGSWLELRADGTFQSVLGFSGRWEVEGDQLTLIHTLGFDTYIIEHGKIMTQTGKVFFVRK